MNYFNLGRREQFTKMKKEAWEEFDARQFDLAKDKFEKIVITEPDSASAYFGLAWSSLSSQGNKTDAEIGTVCEPLFDRAINLHKQNPELNEYQISLCCFILGKLKKNSGKNIEAMALFQSAINDAPKNSPVAADGRNELATCLWEQGQSEDALKLLSDAIQISPEHPYAAKNLEIIKQALSKITIKFELMLGLSKHEIIVSAFPEDTLLDVARRAMEGLGIDPSNGFFMASSENPLPSYLDSGIRDPQKTIQDLRLKDKDSIHFWKIRDDDGQSQAFRLRTQLQEMHEKGEVENLNERIQRAMDEVERYYLGNRIEEAQRIIHTLMRFDPDNEKVSYWQKIVEYAIRERDIGSLASDRNSWSSICANAAHTSQSIDGPLPPLGLAWEKEVSTLPLYSPTIANGYIFISSNENSVFALNVKSGDSYWKWDCPGTIYEHPVSDTSQVFIRSQDTIYCLDGITGKISWKQNIQYFRSVVLTKDKLIGISNGNTVLLLERKSGKVLKRLVTDENNLHALALGEREGVALSNQAILGFDIELSKILWKRTGRFDDIMPVLAYGNVYTGTFSDGLWCLDASTGFMRWAFGSKSWIKAAPAVGKGCLIFGDISGQIGCVDAFTGQLLWTPDTLLGNRSSCLTAPVMADSLIYLVLNNGVIYCLDRGTGAQLWRASLDNWQSGKSYFIVIADALIYTTKDGKIGCLNRQLPEETLNHPLQTLKRPESSIVNIPASDPVDDSTKNMPIHQIPIPDWMKKQDVQDFNLSALYIIEKRFDEALAISQKLDIKYPNQPMILYYMAKSYNGIGMTGDALNTLDTLLNIDPGHMNGFNLLREILRGNEDIINAIYGSSVSTLHQNLPKNRGALDLPLNPTIGFEKDQAVVICRYRNELIDLLSPSPAWYWWQIIIAEDFPVLVLYIEFKYQPYRYQEIEIQFDIGRSHDQSWLDKLVTQPTLPILVFDSDSEYRFSRHLNASEDQRKRLVKLCNQTKEIIAGIPFEKRNFDVAGKKVYNILHGINQD